MEQRLNDGVRVKLDNPDAESMKADSLYGELAGEIGTIEGEPRKLEDLGPGLYYDVRYDNGETAVSQAFELSVIA